MVEWVWLYVSVSHTTLQGHHYQCIVHLLRPHPVHDFIDLGMRNVDPTVHSELWFQDVTCVRVIHMSRAKYHILKNSGPSPRPCLRSIQTEDTFSCFAENLSCYCYSCVVTFHVHCQQRPPLTWPQFLGPKWGGPIRGTTVAIQGSTALLASV